MLPSGEHTAATIHGALPAVFGVRSAFFVQEPDDVPFLALVTDSASTKLVAGDSLSLCSKCIRIEEISSLVFFCAVVFLLPAHKKVATSRDVLCSYGKPADVKYVKYRSTSDITGCRVVCMSMGNSVPTLMAVQSSTLE